MSSFCTGLLEMMFINGLIDNRGRIMEDIRNILFPMDLSENSKKILPVALQVAGKFQAALHIVFVVEDIRYMAGFYVPHPSLDTLEKDMEKAARDKLKEFHDEHTYGKNVQYQVLEGDPAEEIIRFAKEANMDLIVMGTHGRKGLDRLIFGSVAEKVVKNAPVPILIINPHTHLD